LEQLH